MTSIVNFLEAKGIDASELLDLLTRMSKMHSATRDILEQVIPRIDHWKRELQFEAVNRLVWDIRNELFSLRIGSMYQRSGAIDWNCVTQAIKDQISIDPYLNQDQIALLIALILQVSERENTDRD